MTSSTISTCHMDDQVSDNFEVDPTYGSRRRLPSVCTSSSLPTCVRERLEKIDNHPRCCLVTLDHKDYAAIHVAHIIPRSTKAREAATLRKAWDSASHLDVDAVDNLIYLRSDIHATFDKGFWALFPKDELIRAIEAAQESNDVQHGRLVEEREPLQDLYANFSTWNKKKTFEYSFIWIGPPGSALGSPILRKLIPPGTRHPDTDPSTHHNHVQGADELFDIQQQVKLITNTLSEMLLALPDPRTEESEPCDELFHKKCVSLKDSVDKLLDTHPSPNDDNQWNGILGTLRDASASLGAICDDLYAQISSAGLNHRAPSANEDVVDANLDRDARGTQYLRRTLASLTGLIPDYDVYLPPFSDFPVLKSHIHPIFALENAGAKLHRFSEEALAALDPRARRVVLIYRKWHRNNLKAASVTSDGLQDDGSHDGASHCTTEDDNLTGDEPPSSHGSHASEPPADQAIEGNSKSKQVADPNPSIGTPSLTIDEKSSATDEPLDDWAHHYDSLSDWAAACCVDPDIEVTNDRQLRKDSEKPKRLRPQEWERWAKCPPKLPEVIMPEHDTSQLTSYHWALYHQNINLVAPHGSHKVPESHCIPWEVYASRDCDCP